MSRLARIPRSAVAPRPYAWRPDATYLVIGGLGAVGFDAASRMVAAGARHVVLAGRSGPSEAQQAALIRLQRAADVRVVTLDVSSAEAVRALVEELSRGPHPLRGVLHSAGLYVDGIITNQRWDAFERVFAPKVLGSLHLARALEGKALDFVAYFASGASILGSPGQTPYAAANALQDALARRQRRGGVRAVSIDWGAWGEVGGGDRRALEAQAAKKGVGTIDSEAGFAILEYLLAGELAEAAVLPIDWPRFVEAWPGAAHRALFARLVGERSVPLEKPVSILEALDRAAPDERHGLIVAHVRGVLARVLCIDEAAIDPSAPLSRLGMDSLVALQIKHKLELELGVAVPVVELLRGAAIDELSRTLDAAKAKPAPQAKPEVAPEEAVGLLARVGELSDDEVQAELARLLDEG